MRHLLLWVAICMGAGLVQLPAHASRGWMQQAEIIAELTGRRVAGVYPSKVAWAEDIKADGSTDYEEGAERRPGRWNVAGELFCFIYALPHQGGCFRVVRHSANCYELYTASIGGQAPSPPPPASQMSWNGRMWRDTDRATCEEKIVS